MARGRKRKWILLGIALAGVAAFVISRRSAPKIQPGSFLVVDLQGSYAEGRPKGIVGRLVEDKKFFVELLDNLNKARHDDRIAGIILRVGPLAVGWSRAREIRDAFASIRAAGKQVVAHVDSELLGGNKEYYIASAAGRIIMAPAATFMLNGLSAHFYFLGGLWEKLDVTMEVEQIREYKTFGDMLGKRGMTPAHREMANSILDDLNLELIGAIAEARGLSRVEVENIIDSCPSSPAEFVEAGLADEVAFFDEMRSELGNGKPVPVVEESEYRRVSARSLGLANGPKIAIVHAVGTLVGGKGGKRSVLGMTVGSRTLSDALDQAASDDDIHAIVVRIDSPGGSARAADEIWRAMRQAATKKPVVASLGDVAASGGYYIAVGASRILAEANSLTGSIGVVLFKPNVSGLLERLGIGSEALGRGRYARIMDVTKSFNPDELALLRSQMNGVYQRFLDRVAEGRGKTLEEIDRLGGGRVWTGRQALDAGLIDGLGGLHDAVRTAAVAAGLDDPDRVAIVYLPESGGWLQQILDIRTDSVTVGALSELAPLTEAFTGAAALPRGVTALMPAVISID